MAFAAKRKILLLGSGGLTIGQAGEFDYSGNQAIKALEEEGCRVVVVNPNIATVQTDPRPSCATYLYPLTSEWLERIIEKERPDGIVAGFGGQTALNCLIDLNDRGILERYGVKNLGTPVSALKLTEDRDLFAARMREIGIPIPPSRAAQDVEQALEAAAGIGYPVIVRAAYALGGLGSGFARDADELRALASTAFGHSRQALIERSLKGWKELEVEVMRDGAGNRIAICSMENLDPLGVHTGDSIVVAPTQTLTDSELQMLRDAAFRIVDSLGVVGECNVQFALSPASSEYYVIEVNARLSRSSALASKATGYPIAFIAAKVVLGYSLPELKNPVTQVTSAFFEPALDYITVKVPRWDMAKFPGVSRSLGSSMKSVGEVMAIGRSFPEALQKAIRMVTESSDGLSAEGAPRAGDRASLGTPTDDRIFRLMDAFRSGADVAELNRITSIDSWFLRGIREIALLESAIVERFSSARGFEAALDGISPEEWRAIKRAGFGDEQLASLALRGRGLSRRELEKASLLARDARKSAGVLPRLKRVDTSAGEFDSRSNYLFLTYHADFHDETADAGGRPAALVVGSGAYRIGSSVEFDWSAVKCSESLRKSGWLSVMVNCNPETVSTDYNSSDRLYFEEATLERILDIAEIESARGAILCMGGQLPNRLASGIEHAGLRSLGHPAAAIDAAEDRHRFSAHLDRLGIRQPAWVAAVTREQVEGFVAEHGFPLIVRPSFVLSGAAMAVARDRQGLEACLERAARVSPDFPVVVARFAQGALELELDGVACQGEIVASIVSEHVENAGIHSGDATVALPPRRSSAATCAAIRETGARIARELRLNGPFNIQFLSEGGELSVIECNARAARSFPFVSKVTGIDLAALATEVLIGGSPAAIEPEDCAPAHAGVKAAMFSFPRMAGCDPLLGVEMAATGEVGAIAPTVDEALLLALGSAGSRPPRKGVLLSGQEGTDALLDACKTLKRRGIPVFAEAAMIDWLKARGFHELGSAIADPVGLVREKHVDWVIDSGEEGAKAVRQEAILRHCGLYSGHELASAFLAAWDRHPMLAITHEPRDLLSYSAEELAREAIGRAYAAPGPERTL